jgi:hypothetical protein
VTVNGSAAIDVAVSDAEQIWTTAIERYFRRAVA